MEVKEVKFYDGMLLGIRTEDEKIWLAIRTTCIDINLSEKQAENEVKKIKNSLLFENQWKELTLKFKGQVRKITVLSEKFVPIWLAQINLTPMMRKNNPEAVEKLLKYQLEAADVLHNAFLGTEEKAKNFYADLGLVGVIKNLETVINTQKIQNVQINNIETMMEEQQEALEEQQEKLEKVLDNITLTTTQQGEIHREAKNRINFLLDGAHSQEYKKYAQMYFINLWNNLKEKFNCGSRWQDLNPVFYENAIDFIKNWEYTKLKNK